MPEQGDSHESGVGSFFKRLLHKPKGPVALPALEVKTQDDLPASDITLIPEQGLTPELVRKAVGDLEQEISKPVGSRNSDVVFSSLTTIGLYHVAGRDGEKAEDLDNKFYSKWRRSRRENQDFNGEAYYLEKYFQTVLNLKAEPYSQTEFWSVPGGGGINRLIIGFDEDNSFRIMNIDYCSLKPEELHEVGIQCSTRCSSANHEVWRPAK